MRQCFLRASLAIQVATVSACSLEEPSRPSDRVARVVEPLSAVTIRTYDFESLSDWSAVWSSPTLALSSTRVQGLRSLSVSGGGWSSIQSRALLKEEPAPNAVGFELQIPSSQPNPTWFGTVTLFVDVPSRGINNQALGTRDLKQWTPGQWKRAEFALPTSVQTALNGTFNDLRWRIELNRPMNATAGYLFDRFTYGPTCTPVNDGNPCTIDSCNAAGQPVHTPVPAGTGCPDGDACNGAEACTATGACQQGTPPVVDDGNPCTHDACNPTTGVSHTPVAAGTSCADQNQCNGAETCDGSGRCGAGTAVVCTASDACHDAGTCEPTTGVCSNPSKPDGSTCNDANHCNGVETCQAGTCVAGTPPTTDDGNPCTSDGCDPISGTTHAPVAMGTSCADTNPCNGAEACDGAGTCAPGTPVVCAASDACHDPGVCNPISGLCSNPVKPAGTACSDGTPCNGEETCQDGVCTAGTAPALDDGNPCTTDTCDAVAGVTHTPVVAGSTCSNGDACDGIEACDGAGVCVSGALPPFDDGNPCTADACDPVAGVTHVPSPVGTHCGDADLCKGNELCDGAGACGVGTPLELDDGNPCTDDDCDPSVGVLHSPSPEGAPCGGGECNGQGTCVPVFGDCDAPSDGNPCTDDVCENDVVVHRPLLGNPCPGGFCDGEAVCHPLPPEPATVAPSFPSAQKTELIDEVGFLFRGEVPIQRGADENAFDPKRIVVLHGEVLTRDGVPVAGAVVRIAEHAEFGSTLTRVDGAFDLAANGGGMLTVLVDKDGFFPVQRSVETPWEDYTSVPTVRLVARDPVVTEVSFDEEAAIQVARGSVTSNESGTRQATLLFNPGTEAVARLASGETIPLPSGSVRATEYTVGEHGRQAMPASLPPTSGYTYAVELSVDEADALGAEHVEFSRPVPMYVENFLGYPVGQSVPVGFFDRARGIWIPSENGVILRVVSETSGAANVDVTGDGVADSGAALAAFHITPEEQQELARLYDAGQSLWRVELSHFSTWDCNWGAGPPDDASEPPDPADKDGDGENDSDRDPKDDREGKGDCRETGSIVSVYNQTVGQRIPIAGTDLALSYSSARTTRYDRTKTIMVTGETVSASLLTATVDLELEGRRFHYDFSNPGPDQKVEFRWDGNNRYGEPVRHSTVGQVTLTYTYPLLPRPTPRFGAPASGPPFPISQGTEYDGDMAARTFTVTRRATLSFPYHAGMADEGWSIDANHAFDDGTIYYGWGGRRRLPELTKNAVAGAQNPRRNPTVRPPLEAPLAEARFGEVVDMAVLEDGTIIVADSAPFATGPYRAILFRIPPHRQTIQVLGGLGCPETTQEPRPVLDSCFGHIGAIDVAADGTVYVINDSFIDAVSPDGIRIRIGGAGRNDPGVVFRGTGPVATRHLGSLRDVAAAPGGGVYVADSLSQCVFLIAADGFVSDVAGFNQQGCDTSQPAPTGVVAQSIATVVARGQQLNQVVGLATQPDGSQYILEYGRVGISSRIRRLRADGMLETVAGRAYLSVPSSQTHPPGQVALGTDAVSMNTLHTPTSRMNMLLDGERGLYLFDDRSAIRYLSPAGSWDRVRVPFSSVDSPRAVALSPRQSLLAGAVGELSEIDTKGALWRRDTIGIPSETGEEAFLFDGRRHRATVHALTGAELRGFEYTSDDVLVSVRDEAGRQTLVQRRPDGLISSIISPDGLITSLEWNAERRLSTVIDPASQAWTMTYDEFGGMVSFSNPGAAASRYEYDSAGRLVAHQKSDGGRTTIDVTRADRSVTVDVTNPLGAVTRYRTVTDSNGSESSKTLPNGATRTVRAREAETTVTEADGTRTIITRAPDPRWGVLLPIVSRWEQVTPARRVSQYSMTRQVTLANPTNLFSLTSLVDTYVHPDGTTIRRYIPGERRWQVTTPAGRTVSTAIDEFGRIVAIDRDAATSDFVIERDGAGRLSRYGIGAAFIELGYDAEGFLERVTDSNENSTLLESDAIGRPIAITSPASRLTEIDFNWLRQPTFVGMPSGAEHFLTYNGIGLLTSYTPPGLGSLVKTYDPAFQLSSTASPVRTRTFGYDASGRLTSFTDPGFVTMNTFATATHPASITRAPLVGNGLTLAIVRDGTLTTGLRWSGAITAEANYTFDSSLDHSRVDFSVGTQSSATEYAYDADGNLTRRGWLTFQTTGPGGLVARIQDGTTFADDIMYDTSGLERTRRATLGGALVYERHVERDAMGRVSATDETLGGALSRTEYEYSDDNELVEVRRGGQLAERYDFDANGNRTVGERLPGPANVGTYDAADRVLTYGGTPYAVDDDAFVTQIGADSFTYGPGAELLTTVGPTGSVSFEYDGFARRTAEISASGTIRYFYAYPDNHLLVSHVLDGNVLTRYLYDEGGILVGLERAGLRYYVVTDIVGSPLAVMSPSGVIQRRINRDAFGQIIADTNPAFALDIGFAGGLQSRSTSLVRFGLRDYEPRTGRWVARDPILFNGSEKNLFVYVGNDPVNRRDPSGLASGSVTGYFGVGGGFSFSENDGTRAFCAEIGFGFGGGVELNATDTKVDSDGWKIVEELSVKGGPCEAKAAFTSDECGYAGDPGPDDFQPHEARFEAGAKCFGLGAKLKGTVELEGETEADLAPHDWKKTIGDFGAKLVGKIAQKNCVRF
jgi:RHS repeat-associated protein